MGILGERAATLPAIRSDALLPFPVVDELCADNTCRYCHDGIPHEHHDGAEETAKWSDRGNVAISYGCHGDYCPVNAGGYVREPRLGVGSLYHVHYRTYADDHDAYEQEEHQDLPTAEKNGAHQVVALFKEAEQFEYPKYPDETERTYYHQIPSRTEKPSNIQWQCTEKVYDTEKAEDVAAWLR